MDTASNPFRSANVRPQANYWFEASVDVSVTQLVEKLRQLRHAQLIGPHGSGKSTLATCLQRALADEGVSARWVVFHDQDTWRSQWRRIMALRGDPAQLIIVDGMEQLPRWVRPYIAWLCRERLLLVTGHQDLGYPTMFQTEVNPALAQRIVASLLTREGQSWRPQPGRVEQLLQDHKGNMREVLFALYEDYRRARER